MSLLNFEPSNPLRKGSKKPFKLILGIGALVGTIALGSTLAASINLNAGGPVEFGQGVTQTTACDDEITLTPYSSFINADGGGSFMGTRIVISGVDSSTEGCSGKNLTITGFTSSEPIAQIIVEVASESPWFTIGDVYGATLEVESSSSFIITVDPNILPIEASEVTRFTIESSENATVGLWGYVVGPASVFVKSINGISVGSVLTSDTFPQGLIVIEISPSYTIDYPPGCFPPADGDMQPCLNFSQGDSGFVITLSGSPYPFPMEELLYLF